MSNTSPDFVEPGTIVAGRYRVERQLGKGGMGSVYLVQHVHTDQQLALKLLHATVVTDEVALTRFRREARATARVDSDHVVKVTDADVAPELGGVPFLVMEWLRGQSLEERAARAGVLPAEEVALYLRQAARALDKAHAVGIVHRDLKPDNLFLTTREDGTPCLKILDFGIAKLTQGSDEARLKATGTGQVFGTPLYMSPEQIKAEPDKISPQSDVWALGIIAHRLLIGTEPWTATTITALVAQIAYEPIPVPSKSGSTLGPAFDEWFLRCCAREPEDRFPTAGEAVSGLARALDLPDEVPASQVRVDTPVSASKRGRRNDDAAATAFSATAPIPLSSAARPPAAVVSVPRSRRQMAFAFGAAAILVAGIVAGWAYTHRESPAAPPVAANPTKDPPSAAANPTAPTVEIAVTPSAPATAAPSATATQAPAAAAQKTVPASARRPQPTATAAAPAVTAAPVATAPAVPAKPEDPLGTRH